MRFAARWADARGRVDARLAALLAAEDPALAAVLAPALAGGKRLRPAVLLLVHEAHGGAARERAERWAAGVELVHTATLVHDDLIDGDLARRGRPSAHARLRGELAALAARPDARTSADGLAALAGDAALAWGLAMLDDAEAGRRARRALCDAWLGAWHEALPATSPGDEAVARGKTAALFRLACELGALAAGAKPAAVEAAGAYGERLGLAYQWADDAADSGPREALEARAAAEADAAARAAEAFPQGTARDALREAPRALLAAVLPLRAGGASR